MLKPSYASKEEIPEGLQEHYTQKDGIFVLDGFVHKNKVDEFRTNNISLAKEKEELQTQLLKFKDIDPTKYSEAVSKLQDLENDRLAEAGEFKVLKANLEQQHADQLVKEKAARENIQKGWNAEKIANATSNAVLKHALPADGNMRYIQADIQAVTSIDPETNAIVFLDDKGLKLKNEAGDADLTLEEYLTKQYIPKSNLFQKSEGSGSVGGNSIQFASQGQVKVDSISGRDIPGSMIESLASGKIQAVD